MLIDLDFTIPERLKAGAIFGEDPYKLVITHAEAGPEGLLVKSALDGGKEHVTLHAERVQTGVYWAYGLHNMFHEHTSYEVVIRDGLDKTRPWKDQVFDELSWFAQYGIADNLEQILAWKDGGFVKSDRTFVLELSEISKEHNGDFRWHKNGPYIGTQNPQYEHLSEEENIEKVICFHFHEVKKREAISVGDKP